MVVYELDCEDFQTYTGAHESLPATYFCKLLQLQIKHSFLYFLKLSLDGAAANPVASILLRVKQFSEQYHAPEIHSSNTC